MKKITTCFLLLFLLVFFAGCSGKNEGAVETYKSVAEALIESGNIESAIETLQKGIDETGDQELKKMLELINPKADQKNEDEKKEEENNSEKIVKSEEPDEAEEQFVDTFGIKADSYYDDYTIDSYFYDESNYSYTPGKITINPKYVYWNGNTLVAECFVVNGLENEATNISLDTLTIYDMYGEIVATGNFGALNNLSLQPYTYTIWTFNFLENAIHKMHTNLSSVSAESFVSYSSYDLNSASGILASMGLTMEQFKNNCHPMLHSYNIFNPKVIAIGKNYYNNHPDKNTDLYDLTLQFNEFISTGTTQYSTDYTDMNMFTNLEDYLNYKIYGPKGRDQLYSESSDTWDAMCGKYDLIKYIGKSYVLYNVPIQLMDGNKYYSNYDTDVKSLLSYTDIVLYDKRDIKNSPTISIGNSYDFYVVFRGTDTSFGDERLAFDIIYADNNSVVSKDENFFSAGDYEQEKLQYIYEAGKALIHPINAYWLEDGSLYVYFYLNNGLNITFSDFSLKNVTILNKQGDKIAYSPEIRFDRRNIEDYGSYNDTRKLPMRIPYNEILMKNADISKGIDVSFELAE